MSLIHRPNSIERVELHSLTLFNVSDHVVRGSQGKFGIILGTYHESRVLVHTSFETLISSSFYIDLEYLQKRLSQFKTVHPNYELVGIYQISDKYFPNSLTVSVLEQVQKLVNLEYPLVSIVFDENELSIPNSTKSFQSFVLGNFTPIKSTIRTNQSEYIATRTAANNRDYLFSNNSKDQFSDDIPTSQHKENISLAVNLIEEKTLKVLHYLENNSEGGGQEEDSSIRLEINNLIVHLSNKLLTLRESGIQPSQNLQLELQTSQLSLLTKRLTILDNVKAQISRNTVLHGLSSSSQQG